MRCLYKTSLGKTFIPYDFGLLGNFRRYGQRKPPPYDLSKVSAPVYIFYGHNDLLVRPEVNLLFVRRDVPNLAILMGMQGNKYYNIYNLCIRMSNG